MKNNVPPDPSELRTYLDVLGAQFESPSVDREVVFKTCQLIAMAVQDENKPLPDDIFAPGMNNKVARLMIAAGCTMACRIASVPPSMPQKPGIVGANGRPV